MLQRQRRQRHPIKAFRRLANHPGLQAEFPGGQQQGGLVERLRAAPGFVTQLIGICRHAMELGQQHQPLQMKILRQRFGIAIGG